MGCTKNSKALIIWAALVAPVAILFVILGFATDHWLDVDVDRNDLNDIEKQLSNTNQEMARYYHSRHRGILRECYPENSATFLDEAHKVVSDNCFYISFDDPDGDMSSAYKQRMHLVRATLALYVIGMVAIIVNFFIGMALCFTKNRHVAQGASILSFAGGLCVLSSMVMFHAAEYVEANKDGALGELLFQNRWSKNLLKATTSEFGFSYSLAWVGLLLALTDGVLFLLASRALHYKKIFYDSDSSSRSSISSSDREDVIKRSRGSSSSGNGKRKNGLPEYYDNYGAYPMFSAHPAFYNAMPAYPAITYGNSIYSTPEAGGFYEA